MKSGLTLLHPHSDAAQHFRTGEGGWTRLPKPGVGRNCYLMPPRASQSQLQPDPTRPNQTLVLRKTEPFPGA